MEEIETEGTRYTEESESKDKARTIDVLKYDTDVDPNYVPDGFDSVEDFLRDMRETYEADINADSDNREEALTDKRFAAGQQWDPEVLRHRKGLPNLVINSIPSFTAQLVGDWREDRRSVKVLPAEDGDTNVASTRSDLIRSIEMESRASRVYDSAFESAVTCGDGAFRICVEYANEDVFDQDIRIKPIDDALSVVWDRMSLDPTGRDANHVFVDDNLPAEEYKRKWKEEDPSALRELSSNIGYQGWCDEKTVRVTEYWRMIERDRLLAMFKDGFMSEISDENFDELVAAHGMPVKTRLAPVRYAQMHLVTGWKILAGPFEYRLNRVPIIRMTGRVINVDGSRVRYGLVRFMKDPARLRNFWRSVNAEQLGYAPKAQWIATESAVNGYEDQLRKAHLSRDPLIKVSDDAVIGQNIQRLDPPAPQMALMNEAQVNVQDMKDVTGIHDASLGIRSNEVSGKAINARQREGDIASLTYYDNGNEAILEGGDVINQLIGQIYDGTRILRIVGEDEAVKFVSVNDPHDPNSVNLGVGKYDVAMGTGTSYSTRRAEAADAMMQAVQVWPQLLEVAGDLVAKSQDWPGADKLAERLKRTIPQALLTEEERSEVGSMLPAEIEQQMQEMQQKIQEQDMEIVALKQDNTSEMLKRQIEAYNAETQRIRALSDHEVDNTKTNLDAIDRIIEEARFERKLELDTKKATATTNTRSQQV